MANDLESNYKLVEALGLVLLSRVEAEIVSLTYEATRVVKQGLQSQPWLQPKEIEQFVRNHTANLVNQLPNPELMDTNSVFDRFTQLSNQFDQRDQAISSLTSRVARLEEYIAQQSLANASSEPVQGSVILDSRLTAIEESLDSIDLLATELGHRGAATAALDSRVTKLEAAVHETDKLELEEPVDADTLMHVVEGDRTI